MKEIEKERENEREKERKRGKEREKKERKKELEEGRKGRKKASIIHAPQEVLIMNVKYSTAFVLNCVGDGQHTVSVKANFSTPQL